MPDLPDVLCALENSGAKIRISACVDRVPFVIIAEQGFRRHKCWTCRLVYETEEDRAYNAQMPEAIARSLSELPLFEVAAGERTPASQDKSK
jgi:hypothetical protein